MKKLCIATLVLAILFMFVGCQRSSQNHNLNYSQNQSKDIVSAKRELTHLAVVCHLYAQQNNGMLPATMPELRPHVKKPYDLDDYILVASGKLREIDDISRTILIRKKDPLSDGKQAIAYVDGRVRTVRMKLTEDGLPPSPSQKPKWHLSLGKQNGSPPSSSTKDVIPPSPVKSTENGLPPSRSQKPKWHFSFGKPQ